MKFTFDFLPPLTKFFIRKINAESYLVRLQNLGETGTATVTLPSEWASLNWREKSLTANQDKATLILNKPTWNNKKPNLNINEDYLLGTISLRAQEIRTFYVSAAEETSI